MSRLVISFGAFERQAWVRLVFVFAALVLLFALFEPSLAWMYSRWTGMEEYSHGIMIPFVCGYLIWQKRAQINWNGVHSITDFVVGFGLLIGGLLAFVVMNFATLWVGMVLAFLMCFYGLTILTIGLNGVNRLKAPLLMLLLMVPLPQFINNNLSSELQLISSQLGVSFIRLFDISVYLEGNVIDLGSYKLQVVDACSGLRYLYPLVALGFIISYLVDLPLWKKTILFLSTIPITVAMNSLRIGGIGVTVEYWGPEMAEGILHDIEGWFMFMASLAVVLILLKLMLLMAKDRRSIGSVISAGLEETSLQNKTLSQPETAASGYPMIGAFVILLGAVLTFNFSSFFERGEAIDQPRLNLAHFPLFVGDWVGTPDALESIYIDALKFDDYMIANYSKDAEKLNFYIAYYGSQSAGQSAHSPRSCIPGGGWRIESLEQVHLGELFLNSQPLMTNRAVIQKGEARQVVYYWFQQRGRIVTNEYLVKWYLFVDALFDGRTDGALVRLSLPLDKSKDISHADALAADFMSSITYRINDFIPN